MDATIRDTGNLRLRKRQGLPLAESQWNPKIQEWKTNATGKPVAKGFIQRETKLIVGLGEQWDSYPDLEE